MRSRDFSSTIRRARLQLKRRTIPAPELDHYQRKHGRTRLFRATRVQPSMRFITPIALIVLLVSQQARAGGASMSTCARPDSVAFQGNKRISSDSLRVIAAIQPGSTVGWPALRGALSRLMATGYFEGNIRVTCEAAGQKKVLVFIVRERNAPAKKGGIGLD